MRMVQCVWEYTFCCHFKVLHHLNYCFQKPVLSRVWGAQGKSNGTAPFLSLHVSVHPGRKCKLRFTTVWFQSAEQVMPRSISLLSKEGADIQRLPSFLPVVDSSGIHKVSLKGLRETENIPIRWRSTKATPLTASFRNMFHFFSHTTHFCPIGSNPQNDYTTWEKSKENKRKEN